MIRTVKAKSRPVKRPKARFLGIGKQEANRRLVGLGLSRHDDDAIQEEAQAIVARFLSWTGRQSCVATGKRTGDYVVHDGQDWRVVVEAAHLDSRGSYGGDFGNVLPLLDYLHRDSHRDPDFWTRRGLVPSVLAQRHSVKFLTQRPSDAEWLVQHACDGEVIALATTALAEHAP